MKYPYPEKLPIVVSAVDKPQKQTYIERLRQEYSDSDEDVYLSNQDYMRAKRQHLYESPQRKE